MALKTKKANLLFAKGSEEEPSAAENETSKEVKDEMEEPYIVFNTKEEYDTAIGDELKRQQDAQKKEVDNDDNDRNRLISLWQRDAAMLKLIVPDFDLSAALKNEVFKNALVSGKTVFEAYAEAVKPDSAAGRNEIFQNAQSTRRGTGDAVLNPSKLSSEEFRKYIDNIRNS